MSYTVALNWLARRRVRDIHRQLRQTCFLVVENSTIKGNGQHNYSVLCRQSRNLGILCCHSYHDQPAVPQSSTLLGGFFGNGRY